MIVGLYLFCTSVLLFYVLIVFLLIINQLMKLYGYIITLLLYLSQVTKITEKRIMFNHHQRTFKINEDVELSQIGVVVT